MKHRKMQNNTLCFIDGSLCHLKNSESHLKHQKHKGRMVLRGDIVKDDSGSYAVFTEQGSSASQMTAAEVMDVTSRLPGCAGQAADAISAYTQVKNGRCTDVIKNSEVRISRYLDTSSETQMAQIMVQQEDPVVPIERNPYGHPLAGQLWQRQFEKNLLKHAYLKP